MPRPGDDVIVDAGNRCRCPSSRASGGNFENLAINPAPAITSVTDTIDTTTVSLTATPSVAEGGSDRLYRRRSPRSAQTDVTVTLPSGRTITIVAGSDQRQQSACPRRATTSYLDAGSGDGPHHHSHRRRLREPGAMNTALAVTSISDTIDTTTVVADCHARAWPKAAASSTAAVADRPGAVRRDGDVVAAV